MPTKKKRKKTGSSAAGGRRRTKSGSVAKSATRTRSKNKAGSKRKATPRAGKRTAAVFRQTSPLIEVRDSPIHGRGVYARHRIVKGARIVEYQGERVSHAEADSRYELKGEDGHTFLFIVDKRTVIDAGVDGNEARYINHGCDPNCETVTERRRIFIEAIRDIAPGEELCYDYQLTWESTDEPEELALYACCCGAKKCRGTMLDVEPLDKKK